MPVLAGVWPSEDGWSQVTVCPTIVQLAKAPLAEIGVSPAGSVSIAVNPGGGGSPACVLMNNSNVPVCPTVKLPLWLFVKARSATGAGVGVSVAVAVEVGVSVTVAVGVGVSVA